MEIYYLFFKIWVAMKFIIIVSENRFALPSPLLNPHSELLIQKDLPQSLDVFKLFHTFLQTGASFVDSGWWVSGIPSAGFRPWL